MTESNPIKPEYEGWTPDEPDLRKHIRNVLDDLCAGQCDGVDEAYEAITEHPEFKKFDGMVTVRRIKRGSDLDE